MTRKDSAYWSEKRKKGDTMIPPFLDKQLEEVNLLEHEREGLRKQLGVS